MSEGTWRVRVHRSVFAKIVAIMLAMAVSLMLMVAGFYWLILGPSLGEAIELLVAEYAKALAATSPDYETAQDIAARIHLQIRYEGPDGTWTTSGFLPPIEEVRSGRRGRFSGPLRAHNFQVVDAPRGGHYLFAWGFGTHLRSFHHDLLVHMLLLVVAVVFAAHLVIRRALRPLRTLQEGVSRLSEGELGVVLPNPSRDEFGALTDAFNRMSRRVGEMIRSRDQLLLDVSHELRSPLTRMKVALALLPDGDKKERMAADVGEMEAMVHELLELERLRDGRGLQTGRHDLVPILREMVEAFAGHPPGVRFVSSTESVLAEVDPAKVRTVLRNLLENAVKYSLPESRSIDVSVDRTGESVVVRIRDDGPGIPEADLAGLFEPFFRVDRSRSKKTGGYGLGLSICKRVMEAHGGTIVAENNAGRGASFVLRFVAHGGG